MSEDATQAQTDSDEIAQQVGQPGASTSESGGYDETAMSDFVDGLNKLSQLIEPVLEKLFTAAETDSDLWLKKKEVKILTDWQIIQARQVAVMQQMLEQQPRKRLWQPGI